MSRTSFLRPWLAASLGLSLLAGCQPSAGTPTAATGSPATNASPAAPTAQETLPVGVFGRAEIDGVPFAGAEVQIFKPGESKPVATGTTDASGKFVVSTGSVISTGGGNFIGTNTGAVISTGGGNVISTGGGNVISTGGGNVISTGGGNVISTGGGNVIATGGGNLVAPGAPLKVVATKEGQSLAAVGLAGVISTGGGNVISTGGGNVISTGGGNVIATGGLNYQTQALESQEVVLSLGTTVAVKLLGDRLDGVGRAITRADGTAIEDLTARYMAAFDAVVKTIGELLANAPNREALVARITAPDQSITDQISPTVVRSIFQEAAKTADTLAAIIRDGVSKGGTAPSESQGRGLTFGEIQVAPVNPTAPTGATGSTGGGGDTNDGPANTAFNVDGNFDVPGQAQPLSVVEDTDMLWEDHQSTSAVVVDPATVTLPVGEYVNFMVPSDTVFEADYYDQFDVSLVVTAGTAFTDQQVLKAQLVDANGHLLGNGALLSDLNTDGVDSARVPMWDLLDTVADPSQVKGIRLTNVWTETLTLSLEDVMFTFVFN